MHSLNCESILVQSLSDLPRFDKVKDLYADFETTSFNENEEAFLPYNGHRIAGIAVTVDSAEKAWYVPIRHTNEDWNLPLPNVLNWFQDALKRSEQWVNHNVKFDAHFACVDGMEFEDMRLIDTIVLAKIFDSDRLGYGLKQLCKDWLQLPMSEADAIKLHLKAIKSKNYGDCPADLMGQYANMDVMANRMLHRFLQKNIDSDCYPVLETETKLTSVLFDIERFGMKTHKAEIGVERVKCLTAEIGALERLEELCGLPANPGSNSYCYDVLHNMFGLPIIKYTPKTENGGGGNPSFDKEAFATYLAHPETKRNPVLKEVLDNLTIAKQEGQFGSLFLEPYWNLADKEGILHSSYNQAVRTGRMSCRKPNAQQLNKRAKTLIKPHYPDWAILSCDYSQIEFRLIIHYINDLVAIQSYNEDPTTDFHQWVADQCGVKRKAAKGLNFGMGFGAGKRKVVSMLSKNPDIIDEVGDQVTAMVNSGEINASQVPTVFNALTTQKAEDAYYAYHERLPGIKDRSRYASRLAKNRGYVYNAYKRRRHLRMKGTHKAFNAVIQSSAADIMKERMVAMSPRFNPEVRKLGIHMFASVHDEIAFQGPKEVLSDPKVMRFLKAGLEATSVQFSIPIVMDVGYSFNNWAIASGDKCITGVDGLFVGGPVPANVLRGEATLSPEAYVKA